MWLKANHGYMSWHNRWLAEQHDDGSPENNRVHQICSRAILRIYQPMGCVPLRGNSIERVDFWLVNAALLLLYSAGASAKGKTRTMWSGRERLFAKGTVRQVKLKPKQTKSAVSSFQSTEPRQDVHGANAA
jgi:hypothetical protein